ncbi:hypothetical protein [Pectobacterium versatile]|uniref:hypothetical protein n=1 Tax=Pectobacterium versatile TaxID=2488639 RepID=UPI001F1FA5BD|nr:hypothetical protein [Pectobacterium versatile]
MNKPTHAKSFQWPSIEDEHWYQKLKRDEGKELRGYEFFLREFCTVTTPDTVDTGENKKE